jgi:hypothetical protein
MSTDFLLFYTAAVRYNQKSAKHMPTRPNKTDSILNAETGFMLLL